jgi:hypothetical protein
VFGDPNKSFVSGFLWEVMVLFALTGWTENRYGITRIPVVDPFKLGRMAMLMMINASIFRPIWPQIERIERELDKQQRYSN